MIRTFLALEIPDEPLSKIIGIRDVFFDSNAGIKWEDFNKLHITIKFFGDTEELLLNKIYKRLETVLENKPPINLSFNGFGTFRKDGVPKLLWAGFNDNSALINLASGINETLVDLGFPKEMRKFKTHLTLARFKGGEDMRKVLSFVQGRYENVEVVADKITFFKSNLERSGSVYTALKSFYLKKEL